MQYLHKIVARTIYNSRGDKTVECDILFKNSDSIFLVRRSVPSGKSKGTKEAVELPPSEALQNISDVIFPSLFNLECSIFDQKAIDKHLYQLDGTENLSKLGMNSILPISTAFSSYAAYLNKINLHEYINRYFSTTYRPVEMKMPKIFFNMINGGLHSGSPLVFQEIMVAFDDTVPKMMERATAFYKNLKGKIGEKYGEVFTGAGDEGGFVLPIFDVDEILSLLISIDNNIEISIDCAANSFRTTDGTYKIDEKFYSADELLNYYIELISKYENIKILEDPFGEEDHTSFSKLKEATSILIMGDDMSVSNKKYIRTDCMNAVLIKPNQVGLLSSVFETVDFSLENDLKMMMSHRSGETEDTFIVSLAVGLGLPFIKCGAPQHGERIAKYNEMVRIFNKLN